MVVGASAGRQGSSAQRSGEGERGHLPASSGPQRSRGCGQRRAGGHDVVHEHRRGQAALVAERADLSS